MQCSIPSALVFIFLSLAYGSAFAAVQQGLKYFAPILMIFYRMTAGFVTACIVCGVRCLIQKGYWQVVKAHYTHGIKPILWVALGGLLFHGIPHSIIAVAQQWVTSASVQIAQPLATAFGAMLSHFVLPDEPFNWQKALILFFSLTGVALCSIPSFLHSSGGSGVGYTTLGWVLLVLGVACFGLAPVVMKWKASNSDVMASSVIQLGSSSVLTLLVSLIWNGPKKIAQQSNDAPPIAWLWPILVGFLASGLAATGYNYIVAVWGAIGGNLVPFGQIVVGVIVGVAFMKDWAPYKVWEILISCLGIILLLVAIGLGFWHPKGEVPAEKKEEEMSGDLEEIKDVQPTSLEDEKPQDNGDHPVIEEL